MDYGLRTNLNARRGPSRSHRSGEHGGGQGRHQRADAGGRHARSGELAGAWPTSSSVCAGGRRVALVSSGAIGAGMGRLGLGRRPTDLRQLQACAAIGQTFLMRAYEDCLARHGIPTAQILLTAGDFDSRGRYLNARNTILTLVRVRLPARHQRERYGQRRGDPLRRQRSSGGPGHEPAASAAAGAADRG